MMIETGVAFFVAGIPAPQGSKRAFRNKGTGRIQMVESSTKVAPWRERVASEAQRAMEELHGSGLLVGPLVLVVDFEFVRPPSHLTTKGVVRKSAPRTPSPDLDKLVRSTLDGMTGIVFKNDAQVASIRALKAWSGRSGAWITIRPAT